MALPHIRPDLFVCCHAAIYNRSFGVLLWEVVTFGELPLDNLNTEEIIELAETKTLCHQR